jgi:hypothetical protein
VVADRRAGRDAPAALMRYIDLFAPDLPPPADPQAPASDADTPPTDAGHEE